MWPQLGAILWAQFRIVRNHLPRTNLGAVLGWLLSLLWYGMYAVIGAGLAIFLPRVPIPVLHERLPSGLLAIFFYWQVVPLLTFSTGWSLQLNKLQVYPISRNTFFGLETLLCLSTAPEMILVLTGAFIGLLLHPYVPALAPLLLLLYIPFNLFLSLAIRQLILHSFAGKRVRELLTILLISIGVLPQLLLHSQSAQRLVTHTLRISEGRGTPWREVAMLSSGPVSILSLGIILLWILSVYFLAQWSFQKIFNEQQSVGGTASKLRSEARPRGKSSLLQRAFELPGHVLRDPTAALLEKELRSLLRMPRFRVMFGMACIFGILIFIPMTFRGSGTGFVANNFLPMVSLYGLLLLGDVLIWNVFGFDRYAAQLYFVAPVRFETVLKAKNLASVVFIMLQTAIVCVFVAALRMVITPLSVINAFAASAVAAVFFLGIGNLTSVAIPKPMNPAETFRKQSSGKMQLSFFATTLGMFLLLGSAFAARWALQTNWALLGVLAFEFVIGLIVYHIATESAVERGIQERERILDELLKSVSPIS
jgi:ABC-2 type transport system permease protein